MFGLGIGELVILFLFALLFIGPSKLPELAKNLGKGIREFQKAKQGLLDDEISPTNQINSNQVVSIKQETTQESLKKVDETDFKARPIEIEVVNNKEDQKHTLTDKSQY